MQTGDQWETCDVWRVWLIAAVIGLVGCATTPERVSSAGVAADPEPPASSSTTRLPRTASSLSGWTSSPPTTDPFLRCVEDGWRAIEIFGASVDGVVVVAGPDDRTRLCDAETGAVADLGLIPHGQVGLAPVGTDSVVVVDFSGSGGAWSAWWLQLVGDRWTEVHPVRSDIEDDRLVAGLHCRGDRLVRSVVDPFATVGSMTIGEEVVGDEADGAVAVPVDEAWVDAVASVQLECAGVLLAPPRRLSLQIATMLVEAAGGVVLSGDHVIDPLAVALAERDGLRFSVGVDVSGDWPAADLESVWLGECPFGVAVVTGESPGQPAPESIVADVAVTGRCSAAAR